MRSYTDGMLVCSPRADGEEGVLLFTEASPVLSMALDTSGSCDSLWVATTSTHVNKWPIDIHKANGFGDDETDEGNEESEEDGITDIDDPTPFFTKPIATIPGTSLRASNLGAIVSFPSDKWLGYRWTQCSAIGIFGKVCPLVRVGGSSIKEHKILNNRQQVLTRDNNNKVALWDILHVSKTCCIGTKI